MAVIETGRFRLPGGITYKAAVAFGSGFLAAGFTRRGVAAVQASFAGEIDSMTWDVPLAELRPLLLAADAHSPTALIAVVGGPSLQERFLGHDRIGTPAWFTPHTLAAAASRFGVWWSIDDELLLSALRVDGSPFSSRQLSLTELGVRAEPRDEPPERLAVMLARRDEVYLGLGHTLVAVKGDRVEQTQLQGWIRQLTSAPLVLQLRLAASFEDYGAAVIWDDLNGRDVIEFGLSLERPELAFTLDGLLVAVNHQAGHIYSTSNRTIAMRARLAGPGGRVAGVLCGERPGEFVVLTEAGEVIGYRIE